MVKLGPQIIAFYVCIVFVLGIIILAHWALCSSHPPLFYCLGARLVFLLPDFVVKQACLILWLSKPGFLRDY